MFAMPQLLLILAFLSFIGPLAWIFIRNLVDFPVYYAAGASLISGRTDLYAADFARGPTMDYRYPPFFLVSLIPLWHLPYPVAAYVWYIVELVGTGASCWAVVVVLARGRHRHDAVEPQTFVHPESAEGKERLRQNLNVAPTLGLALLGVAQYYVMALHYGNAQLLVASMLVSALYLAMRGRDLSSGLLVALAITIKITPALFLGYFALKRRWKLMLITVGLVLAFNLAPAIYFGFARNTELIRTWYGRVIARQEFHEVNGPINLSLKGQLVRSLTRVDYSQRIDGDTRYPAMNLANYPYTTITRLWLPLDVLAVALGLALIAWAAHSDKADGLMPGPEEIAASPDGVGSNSAPVVAAAAPSDARRFSDHIKSIDIGAIEIGIMFCLMLLAAPLTSKIYFVSLLWPLAVVLGGTANSLKMTPRVVRWGALAVVVTNVVLPLLPGRSIQRFLLVLGVDFYLTCLILAMLVWALLASRRATLS
jgi:hypothetical protein